MKIYNKQTIKYLQHALKNVNNLTLNVFKDYSFLINNRITCGEITLHFFYDTKLNRNDAEYIINNYEVNSIYLKDWKTSAPGKFLIKDFKLNNRDFTGNTPYYELHYIAHDKKYKAIIRLLIEVADPEISEADKIILIDNYGDIKIDDRYFSVIKICFDTESDFWSTKEKIRLLNESIELEHDKEFSSIINNKDMLIPDENTEELMSDPLF